jgi:hypothetical protein
MDENKLNWIELNVSAGWLPSSEGYKLKLYVAWCLAALNGFM